MSDVNHVILIGNLTKNSELKYTSGGCASAYMSIAVNRSVKKGDTWEKQVNYFEISYYNKAAEKLNAYLTKGMRIAVQGSLQQDRWEKDGVKNSKIKIIAENIQLLGCIQNNTSSNHNVHPYNGTSITQYNQQDYNF